ncbi:IS200/IS605 family element transposase accessory protein TnpB [Campylobacter hyointestinalis]|uniref:IS200/IS605 family element transposase accessory protein TnpB n=1 Tax=Campylobacter hyointestinalis TaxID=198 RepID=A0A562X762_CAMHY|nr:RNA-guided endonuclease TnpB family protein [Campylobacter hyointestinalis]TWO18010.1 IS200/IS605 family element transposase accessory protein TnpB [Campylobacter hyointestinalis]
MRKEEVQTAIELDLNINEVELSSDKLVETRSKQTNKIKYTQAFKKLQRKQSRRVEKAKKTKIKLSKNFRKTQRKLNKKYEKALNIKKVIQHKFSKEIVDKFDLIVVENLNVKNMTKRAKLKNVKAKSGLNRSILDTSFSQLISFLEYKAKHNGKLFTKIPPQYTSKGCSNCGTIKFDLKLKDRTFICDECGFVTHRDLNAAINILRRGLKALNISIEQIKDIKLSNVKSKSFELGISLLDSKQKAFRVS